MLINKNRFHFILKTCTFYAKLLFVLIGAIPLNESSSLNLRLALNCSGSEVNWLECQHSNIWCSNYTAAVACQPADSELLHYKLINVVMLMQLNI